MELARLIFGLIGLSLILWFSEGEFVGTAGDEARRVRFRRIGVGLVVISLIVGAYSEFG